MKLFIASLGTETNTFAPMPTGHRSFEDTMVFRRDATRHAPQLFTEALHVWQRKAKERDWVVFESLAAFAQPAGPTARTVYESFRDEILADLRSCDDVDAVLIQMHGAMVADGYEDCEGDFLQRVREVASQAVIGLELDLHCHLTQDMMDASDVIVTFKEYPHTDASQRAAELFQIVADTAAGKVTPVMHDFDCKMISMYMTAHGPMRDFVDAMIAAEGRSRVLSLSLIHGFPWGDVDRVGTRMLAVTDGDCGLAKETATSFGQKFIALRNDIDLPPSNHTSCYEIGWVMKEVIDATKEAFGRRGYWQAA